jgi:hypothetical protein
MANNSIFNYLLVLTFSLASLAAKATTEPTPNASPLQLTALNKQLVQVKATITSSSDVYFELEKSYDNKTFTTVCVLMPFEDATIIKPILLKDKVTTGSTTVYYRIKQIKDNNITYTAKEEVKL